MNTSAKIAQIRAKIAAKKKKVEAHLARSESAQASANALKEEIEVLEKEILSLQMKQFSEKLSKKGITFDEIEQAIEAGIFDKSENDKNCATNSTINADEPIKEEKPDEVSGS